MALESNVTLCSKCRNPLEFKPPVDVNSANLNISSDCVLDPDKICEMVLLSNKALDDYDAKLNRLQSQILFVERFTFDSVRLQFGVFSTFEVCAMLHLEEILRVDLSDDFTETASSNMVHDSSSTDLNHYETDQSLLSPFLESPNEIIRIIFEFTCTDNFLQEYPWPLDRESRVWPGFTIARKSLASL